MELSYSFHLGNDSNKTIKARQQAKNTTLGTTSKGNNAIQNIKHLGKVNNHNLRQCNNNQELIKTIKGSDDIVKDVKELYLDLFEEARLEYNNKQVRDDIKIDNYFNKISNDDKHDLACEIIIELGDMSYWENKSLEEKTYYLIYHLNKVLKKLPEFIQNIVERLFNYSGLDLKYFKQQYEPEVKRKEESRFKGYNPFSKKEIEKTTKNINDDMDEYAEEFYNDKNDKEKDDGLSL